MTSTHTHTVVSFADPHLVCGWCAATVAGYRHAPGHDDDGLNVPCGHRAAVESTCPSWDPVNGCECRTHLGTVDHEEVRLS